MATEVVERVLEGKEGRSNVRQVMKGKESIINGT